MHMHGDIAKAIEYQKTKYLTHCGCHRGVPLLSVYTYPCAGYNDQNRMITLMLILLVLIQIMMWHCCVPLRRLRFSASASGNCKRPGHPSSCSPDQRRGRSSTMGHSCSQRNSRHTQQPRQRHIQKQDKSAIWWQKPYRGESGGSLIAAVGGAFKQSFVAHKPSFKAHSPSNSALLLPTIDACCLTCQSPAPAG
jgi:hypothetical protein